MPSAGNRPSVAVMANPSSWLRRCCTSPAQAPDAARTVDPGDATAWRRGTIAIRDRSLADALREIERYRPGRIVLLGDITRFQPVTARIALRDIDGGIAALAATHRLQVVHVTDYLVILR